jgi:TonB family protein
MVSASMAWPEAPGYAAVAAAYPAKARAARLGGRATVTCEFNKEGRLRDCETITEEPKYQGFGDAARKLAKQFRAFPTLTNGKSISGASIELPVVFDPAMLADAAPVIGKAQWAGLPSTENTVAAFGGLKVDGVTRVRLACVVQQGGAVSDCRVEQETPAGHGVGAAALSLAPHFRLTTWTAEGLPTVGGTINIPLRYEPKDPPETPKG